MFDNNDNTNLIHEEPIKSVEDIDKSSIDIPYLKLVKYSEWRYGAVGRTSDS